MTSVAYIAFLKGHLKLWFKSKPLSLKIKIIYMHDNAPSHAAKTTGNYQQKIGLKYIVSFQIYRINFRRI